ncbi:hypothetical protein DSM104635_01271 [Terricaulis silvestris]|uniref:Uncharacterized protein n=2 Tax=Terricaulis silvestris TaxID=2686094 RepID=A0A6I6MS12_9CAUL|nr:hypothetical protein DSM104635_01271 [Terricaulis silvestris]
MRILVAIGAIALCVAGAALAREEPQANPELEYERQPTGPDYARNFPPGYNAPGSAGLVVLCCRPNAERGLSCDVAFEAPRNVGFSQATLNIVRRFRLTPESYAAYQAGPRLPIRRTIHWIMNPKPEGWDDYAAQVRTATAEICEPPPASPTPSPN